MFCSRPFGRPPEVTGPYCSQTRSGALPPEAWLSRVAFAALMLAVLLGSHCTVKPLCAASHWLVSFFSPALSAAVIGPVFGGSTALMTPEPPPLVPPDEHPGSETAGQHQGGQDGQPSGEGSGQGSGAHKGQLLDEPVSRGISGRTRPSGSAAGAWR